MADKEKIKINLAGMLGTIEIDKFSAIKLGNELISVIVKSDAIDELNDYPTGSTAGATERDLLRELMIRTLVEKFGLEINCGNCRFLHKSDRDPKGARGCVKDPPSFRIRFKSR